MELVLGCLEGKIYKYNVPINDLICGLWTPPFLFNSFLSGVHQPHAKLFIAPAVEEVPANIELIYCCLQSLLTKGEWLFVRDIMERNRRASNNNEKKPLENSAPPANVPKKPSENNSSTSIFVNHAAIAWDESRRKWIGTASQRLDRKTKDQMISWSTTYEDLLSTHEPFTEPIPLPEMVDFLVDIWHDEGLFD